VPWYVLAQEYTDLCTNLWEELSEKGFEQRWYRPFGRYTEDETSQMGLLGGPWGYSISTSEPFRAISKGAFSEVYT
jgi:hypothetical protein